MVIRKIENKFVVSASNVSLRLKSTIENMCNKDREKCVLYLKSNDVHMRTLSTFILKTDIDKYVEITITTFTETQLWAWDGNKMTYFVPESGIYVKN
jgi:hypothetical protein